MKPLVSVVVPFYNEAENVEPLVRQVMAVLDPLDIYDWEAVLVNDGSTDGTAEQLNALAASNARIVPLHFARNFGQSAALVAGMRRAQGAYILTLDGDLQNDPADFPAFLELLQTYDCVCGYRVNRNDTWIRRFSSRVANAVRNAILQDGIRDSGCGSKGFRRACVEHLVPFNGLHRFFAVFMRAWGFSVVEHPVQHHPRHRGVSKYGIGNRLWRGLYDLIGVVWLRNRLVPYVLTKPTPTPRNNTAPHTKE